MKKIVIFSVLLAMSIWALVFVAAKKEKKSMDAEKVTVIESQSASSPPALEAVSSQSTSPASPDYRLRVLSEPEGAEIFVENEKQGVAPFEVAIPAESKKLKLSMAGYEDYERQIPAAKDSEGDLVWKIQLKKVQATPTKVAATHGSAKEAAVTKEVAPKAKEISSSPRPHAVSVAKFFNQEVAPFSVQIKAVPLGSFVESEKNFADVHAKLCRVKINDNAWVRVITGPYANKQKAAEALNQIKKKYPEAFLSTKQKCLADREI